VTVLNEKEIPYEIEYIDLSNKPDWFLALSPTGKVPVVLTPEGHRLFESAVINEYLDEMHPPHVMPSTPLGRAQDRMWQELIVGMYGDVYQLYSAADDDRAQAALDGVRVRLGRLEEEVEGPFFSGERFSLVDATAGPAFMRLTWANRLAPAVDAFEGFPKVSAWRDAVLARPSVESSVLPNLYEIFSDSVRRNEAWLSRQ